MSYDLGSSSDNLLGMEFAEQYDDLKLDTPPDSPSLGRSHSRDWKSPRGFSPRFAKSPDGKDGIELSELPASPSLSSTPTPAEHLESLVERANESYAKELEQIDVLASITATSSDSDVEAPPQP